MSKNEFCKYQMSQNDEKGKENTDLRKDRLILKTSQDMCNNTTKSVEITEINKSSGTDVMQPKKISDRKYKRLYPKPQQKSTDKCNSEIKTKT